MPAVAVFATNSVKLPKLLMASVFQGLAVAIYGMVESWMWYQYGNLYSSHLALGQNLVALVNIKIAGIYGSFHPTHIDHNRV